MTVSLDEVSQTFNTKKLFKTELSDKEKRDFGKLIKDAIVERTLSGVDNGSSKFRKYKKEYAKFKGVGVNDVDLKLKNKMLKNIKVELDGNDVKVKVAEADTKKAYNHQIGDTLPTRSFFGVGPKQLRTITEPIKEAFQEIKEEEVTISEGNKLFQAAVKDAEKEMDDIFASLS